ncbi:hypothetical protein ACFVZH_25540 [Streptomyces sp. NPDC059534]|uniref:hypothetical protein n=1 Tax=Streptomyces sp. NPDC059534 TaxID=3346859 RepID=UPI00369C4F32
MIAVTAHPTLRERREAEALRLLRDAEHPPRVGLKAIVPAQVSAVRVAQTQAAQIQVYERLTRAWEQESELCQTAVNSATLIWVLLRMVSILEERVRKLTGQCDRLAGQAEAELARAEERRRQAEDLADRLRREIEPLTDELGRLRGDGPSPHDHLPTRAGAPTASTQPGDAESDDIDAALAKAIAVSNEDADTIDRISTEITGLPASATGTEPDVADNSPAGPDAVSTSALQVKEAADAAAARGDAAEAARLHGVHVTLTTAYLGREHPDALSSRHDHAQWTEQAGDPAAARDLHAALVTDRTRVLGPRHGDTLATASSTPTARGWPAPRPSRATCTPTSSPRTPRCSARTTSALC